MSVTVACQCGNTYELKDEFAGRAVKCPNCGTVNTAPRKIAGGDPAFDRDKFLLRQKAMAINEKYYIWDEGGKQLLFVERPTHVLRNLFALLVGVGAAIGAFVVLAALAQAAGAGPTRDMLYAFVLIVSLATMLFVAVMLQPKRHVTFYRDDRKTERILEVLQDKKFQPIITTYTVRDPQTKVLARFRKNYLYNLFRKRWECRGPEGSIVAVAREDSIILSLLRRFLGPFFGLLRTNFVIQRGTSDNVVGEFNRKFTLLDRYVLDLSRDPRRQLDRRVMLALGVMLDTGERR
jgi:uncharacterized protein YxjI